MAAAAKGAAVPFHHLEVDLVVAPRVDQVEALRLAADHQLNLLDRWLNGQAAVGAPAMTEAMRSSLRALCAGLRA